MIRLLGAQRLPLARTNARHTTQVWLALAMGGLVLGMTVTLSLVLGQAREPASLRTQVLLVGAGFALVGAAFGWLLAARLGGGHDGEERQRLEHMKDHFIATVSHELRTPLTSINGSLGLLAAGLLERQPERAERMLRIAATNADRLARLVDDVVDLERLAAGRAALDVQPCSAAHLVRQAIDGVPELAERNQLDVLVEPAVDPMLRLDADPRRIVQVLRNLLDNAAKFSAPGTRVRLSVQAIDKDVRFSVSDQGQGMQPEQLRVIFDRFQHGDMSDARQAPGSGLGLAMCRSIVEAHGGAITAASPGPGAGSTFSFVIPR